MKNQVILVASQRMDSNQKSDRNENKLIRIGEKARRNLGLSNDKSVELWPDSNTSKDRINKSRLLLIFQAYTADLKELSKSGVPSEEYNRIGFVTTKTFKYICNDGRKKKADIWISDTIEDTVIGADPEFILLDGEGYSQYAAKVSGLSHEGQLGSDGPLAELRPDPETSIKTFVNNIKDLLNNDPAREYIEPYDWVAGCYYNRRNDPDGGEYSIGGHAHIGTPTQVFEKLCEDSRTKSSLFSCLQKALDEYVTIPMLKIEDKEDAIKRRRHYGHYGDHKTDHGRLEYRSLSGFWLAHPKFAEAVMGSVKAVSHAFFKIIEEGNYNSDLLLTSGMKKADVHGPAFNFFSDSFDKWNEIGVTKALKATRTSHEMRVILNDGTMSFTKDQIEGMKRKFKSLSTYRKYSEYIDMFMEIASLPIDKLKEIDCNLKHTWIGNKKFII